MAKSSTQESSTMALLQNMKTEKAENTKRKEKQTTALKETIPAIKEEKEKAATVAAVVEKETEEKEMKELPSDTINAPKETLTGLSQLNIKPKEKRDVRKGFLFTKSVNDAFAKEAKEYGVKENELIIQILSARYNIQ